MLSPEQACEATGSSVRLMICLASNSVRLALLQTVDEFGSLVSKY